MKLGLTLGLHSYRPSALELALLAVGDSITAGFGVPSEQAWPSVLADRSDMAVGNVSLTGRKLSTMDADYATLVAPSYQAGKRNVLVLLGGSNDILNEGGSPATLAAMQASMVSFLGKAVATGFEVHVCTLLMWGGIDATKSQRREDFNAWLRSSAVANGAARVIDTAALIEFQRPYENYYWNADLVHLSANGYAHVADAIGGALGLGMAPATLYRPTGNELLWGTTTANSITALVNVGLAGGVVATYRSAVTGAVITANLGTDAAVVTDISSLPAPRIISISQPATPASCVGIVIDNAGIAGRMHSLTGYTGLAFLSLLNSTISGPPPVLTGKPGLAIVALAGCKFAGDLAAMPAATGLFLFNVEGNLFQNAIPSFAANVALQILNLKGNLFLTYAGASMPATLASIDASNNLMAFAGAAQVNAILTQIDAAGGVGPDKIIVLTGANMPAPSGAGATAKTALQGKLWTVLTQ